MCTLPLRVQIIEDAAMHDQYCRVITPEPASNEETEEVCALLKQCYALRYTSCINVLLLVCQAQVKKVCQLCSSYWYISFVPLDVQYDTRRPHMLIPVCPAAHQGYASHLHHNFWRKASVDEMST